MVMNIELVAATKTVPSEKEEQEMRQILDEMLCRIVDHDKPTPAVTIRDEARMKILPLMKPIITKEEALKFGRAAARVCYTEKDFGDVVEEANPERLINQTLKSGHHSVYDHTMFSFYMAGIPKILAMILNNESTYTTSEKSARYTQMQPTPEQKVLYDKWMGIFEIEIAKKYPENEYPSLYTVGGDKKTRIQKLAQENARYLTSVFTPTKMVHTVSFRQLNRIMHSMQWELETNRLPNTNFYNRVKAVLEEFVNNETLKPLLEERLDYRNKKGLSIFSTRHEVGEQFGEVYSVNYWSSFAYLAQAHRHRTIDYRILLVDDPATEHFVPPAIRENELLKAEWYRDMDCVSETDYPQGQLILINESGRADNFKAKCCERLCGQAQLETMLRTDDTLKRYIREAEDLAPYVSEELLAIASGPKCTFPGMKCTDPCAFGRKALERLI